MGDSRTSPFQEPQIDVDNPQSREEDEELQEQQRRQEEVSSIYDLKPKIYLQPSNYLKFLVSRFTSCWNSCISV